MRYLTLDNFVKKDGFSFEDLTQKILRDKYGDVFIPTKYTNDGGKDFFSNQEVLSDFKIWVECKMYKNDNLSFNDVTKTLLMAYVEDINKIIFFSYSKVNSRFKKQVEKYKDKTTIDVEIYDDELLENLILEYQNKEWFTDFIKLDHVKNISSNKVQNYEVEYYIDDKLTEDKKSGKIHINLNDLIYLNVIITNKSLKQQKFTIDILEFNKYNYYEILNIDKINQTVGIEPAQSKKITIILKIKNFQKTYFIPSIKINNCSYCINKQLYTNWLAQTSLVGKKHIESLQICSDYLMNNKKLSVVLIKGESGIGKSKMIQEVVYKLIGNHLQCYTYDSDNTSFSFSKLSKELLSAFTKLPFFELDEKIINNIVMSNKDNTLIQVAKILYDQNFDFDKDSDKVIKYILYYLFMQENKVFFENIQRYDEKSIDFINEIINNMFNKECRSAIVLTYNTDEGSFNQYANTLINRIETLATTQKEQYKVIELSSFNKRDVFEYLCKILQISSSELKKHQYFLRQLEDHIGFIPLNLNSHFISLKEQGVINFDNDSIQFTNIDYFYSSNYNFDFLIRYKNIVENIGINCKFFVSVLSFCKYLSPEIIKELGYSNGEIEPLIKMGIVTLNDNYSFRHNSIRRYFQKEYKIDDININHDKLKNILLDYQYEYMEQIFILEYRTENFETIEKIVNRIKYREINPEFALEIFSKFLSKKIEQKLEPETYVDSIIDISYSATLLLGISASLKYYQKVFDLVLYNKYKSIGIYKRIISAIKEYIRHLLNTDQNQEAYRKLEIFKEIKHNLPNELLSYFDFEYEKIKLLCLIKQNKIEVVIDSANKLLKEVPENSSMISELYMLIGNAYYRGPKYLSYKNCIVNNWRKVICNTDIFKFNNYSEHDKAINLNSCIRKIMVGIINRNHSSENYIHFLSKIINQTGMVYFEVKIRQILAIYYHINNKVEQAIELVEQSIDILHEQYGNQYLYADSVFLLAQIYKTTHNYDKMYDYYLNFISLTTQINRSNKTKINSMLLQTAFDLKLYTKEYKPSFDWSLFNLVDNPLSKEIDRIRIDEINNSNNIPKSLLHNSALNCDYPMI